MGGKPGVQTFARVRTPRLAVLPFPSLQVNRGHVSGPECAEKKRVTNPLIYFQKKHFSKVLSNR